MGFREESGSGRGKSKQGSDIRPVCWTEPQQGRLMTGRSGRSPGARSIGPCSLGDYSGSNWVN